VRTPGGGGYAHADVACDHRSARPYAFEIDDVRLVG